MVSLWLSNRDHAIISQDHRILFSSLTIITRTDRQKVKIFSGKIILADSLDLLSHSAQWYHYIPTCMLCLCVQCMYMWKYLACIWKVEVAWPMGSHFVEWWGSLLRRWVRRTSPHFVACHFTLRQTIRLTLSTPKLRHHHQLRCTQLYMYILLISSVQLMVCFIFHLWLYFIRFSYFQL